MKKLFAILTILITFSIFCERLPNEVESEHRKSENRVKNNLFLALILAQNIPLDSADCMEYSRPLNSIYGSGYFQKFRDDSKQYENLFLGDSTIDLASRYEGYYDKNRTQILAVSGNTLCDMNAQMGVINTKNPKTVLFSTSGGNDLLRQIPNDKITQSGKGLIDKIRSKFPESKIIGISTNPTKVDYANQNKKAVNDNLKNYLADRGNSCFIDVLELFGIPEGQAANQSDLIDTIHPNKEM
ncbi:MAG: SGNH/GDSL hydrolase family protein, partial [Leptospira sp.]|nr:SGNH/GDSL hydrolase family protein [Leptospira sp.]